MRPSLPSLLVPSLGLLPSCLSLSSQCTSLYLSPSISLFSSFCLSLPFSFVVSVWRTLSLSVNLFIGLPVFLSLNVLFFYIHVQLWMLLFLCIFPPFLPLCLARAFLHFLIPPLRVSPVHLFTPPSTGSCACHCCSFCHSLCLLSLCVHSFLILFIWLLLSVSTSLLGYRFPAFSGSCSVYVSWVLLVPVSVSYFLLWESSIFHMAGDTAISNSQPITQMTKEHYVEFNLII